MLYHSVFNKEIWNDWKSKPNLSKDNRFKNTWVDEGLRKFGKEDFPYHSSFFDEYKIIGTMSMGNAIILNSKLIDESLLIVPPKYTPNMKVLSIYSHSKKIPKDNLCKNLFH